MLSLTRQLPVLLAALVIVAVLPQGAGADLQGQISHAKSGEHALAGAIGADTSRIQGYQGRIDDLQARLNGIEQSLAVERAQLQHVQDQLRTARARLVHLRLALSRDTRVLSAQLVAQYEASRPDLVTVVLQSHGFAALIETAEQLHRVQQHNTEVVGRVAADKKTVAKQARTLGALENQQEAQTAAVLSERDQVDRIRLTIVNHQLQFLRARATKRAELGSLSARRKSLENRLSQIQAKEASVTPGVYSGSVPPATGSFAGHGGAYGFFPAPGTNYSVGEEPSLAQHLDVLGKALHLHLIGLSGYRSPEHSVEVGGFADDPHTKGLASDTPGVEGVPEGTLNRFGLTRPFPGPAEADHIQLVGSI